MDPGYVHILLGGGRIEGEYRMKEITDRGMRGGAISRRDSGHRKANLLEVKLAQLERRQTTSIQGN
jgi:hypothetical protein